MLTRRITPKITIAGKDVTRDLAPYLLEINYEDVLSGEADTLDIMLWDSNRLFIGDYFPTLSDTLQVSLTKENWQDNSNLDLGTFEIDEVQAAFPPSTFKIKAVSISQNSELRQHDESKAWENLKLSELAAQIAADSGVELFFQASYDPEIKRAEQGEQSRLAFLEKICADNYLALKVDDGKLIIFDESELDKQSPVATIERDTSNILRFSAKKTLQEVYKSAQVSYKHGDKDELFQGSFDSGAEKGKVLKINKKVEDKAAAERLAKNSLRDKNKKETEVRLELVGSFEYLAGNVVELKGFGKFDGNYLIERARHKVGSGYSCDLELRQCLSY